MSTDAGALLTLAQWLSPAFPVGGFAHSHGLDRCIAAGELRDAAGLRLWLEDTLRFGAGRSDAILLSLAHRGVLPDADLAALAAALAGSAERWQETLAQGRAFAACHGALTGTQAPAVALPLAVGRAARALALPTETVAALYLQSFAGNLVAVATRAVPLGQTEGQRVLQALQPAILALAAEAAGAGVEDLGGAVPLADIAAMLHETQEVRLFLT